MEIFVTTPTRPTLTRVYWATEKNQMGGVGVGVEDMEFQGSVKKEAEF